MGLKKYVNRITGTCFPAKKKLAEECGISMSTLNKAINKLTDAGVLKKEYRYRQNRSQTSNLYTLTPFLISGESYFKMRQDILELGLKTKEIVIYAYLCSAANQDMECYPSIREISVACDLSETTIKGTIKELINKGFIEKISQYREDGGKKNNLYRIVQEEVIIEEPTAEVAEEIIGQDQLNDEYLENIVEHVSHEDDVQTDINKIINKNDFYNVTNTIKNKKVRREVSTMKLRSDIFDFKLSENSFILYLYVSNYGSVNKANFPSIVEICKKLNMSDNSTKASLAELEIKGLIKKADGIPIGILNTPPWAKKTSP